MSDTQKKFRSYFSIDEARLHLNNAGIGPLSIPAKQAIDRLSQIQAESGCFGFESFFSEYEGCRESFAKLVGVKSTQIGMTASCAAAISQVALGREDLDSGHEILICDQEYPSNAYPWSEAARRSGAKLIQLKSESDLRLPTEKVIEAIGPKTKMVGISWVQYQSGAVSDLKALSQACQKVGAWLVVDAIQALGVRPFDLEEMGVDAVCGGTHKWLCGPIGLGFLALREEHISRLRPILMGAMSYGTGEDLVDLKRPLREDARKFEPGSPNVLNATAARASVDMILKVGVAEIQKVALERADQLHRGLLEKGCTVLTRNLESELRSSIVTFLPPKGKSQTEEVSVKLQKAGVVFARRAGGIRVSPHGFNTTQEIDRFLDLI